MSLESVDLSARDADRPSAGLLVLASAASAIASACCVVPLVFAIVGISGAWIARLRVFEPYSPGLSVLAVASLGMAAWQIFSRRRSDRDATCGVDGTQRGCDRDRTLARRWFWGVAVLTLIPIVVPLAAPLFY
jgi:mercuric ion transport protein